LLRNEGGSVGTSVAQTIHERRDQLHSLHLGENLDKLNPAREILSRAGPGWLFTAHRQSRCRQADGAAITRRRAPAIILRARLFRHILCLRRGWGRVLLSRPANQTLGRGKGRARRRRVGRHEDGPEL
jgi:hypothetical protein